MNNESNPETLAENRLEAQLAAVAEPLVRAVGCELVALGFRREPQGLVLRVSVEREGHDPRLLGGVTLEQCVAISRDLSTALEVADVIQAAYHLEVSSPGLDRPISRLEEYTRFAGISAKIVLSKPIASHPGHKAFRGEILGTDHDLVLFMDDDLGKVELPFAQILRGNLVYKFPARTKPKGRTASQSPIRPSDTSLPRDDAGSSRRP